MPMDMSSILAKPSTCINFHGFSPAASKRPSLASYTRLFHPRRLERVFHYSYRLGSSRPDQRRHIVSINAQPVPPPPPPPTPPSNSFPGLPGKGWIAGIVLSLFLPFLRSKWGPLLSLKQEVDKDLQTIETTVEVLEKVAESVDKLSEDLGKDLPAGRLKKVAAMVEHVAEEAATTAHMVDEAIDKVQELEDKVDSFMESNESEPSKTSAKSNDETA